MKRILIPILLAAFCIISSNAIAADLYYISPTGSWFNSSNWSLDGLTSCSCLPTASDDVMLNSNGITVLSNGITAVANSIDLSSSTLNVNPGGALVLSGIGLDETLNLDNSSNFNNSGDMVVLASDFRGIYNSGTIINDGNITIVNTINSLVNRGDFTNNGSLIANDDSYLLVLEARSIFTNNGLIEMNGPGSPTAFFSTGIRTREATFINYGVMNMTDVSKGLEFFSSGSPGIDPKFENHAGAEINIIRPSIYGISNDDPSSDYPISNFNGGLLSIQFMGNVPTVDFMNYTQPGLLLEGDFELLP